MITIHVTFRNRVYSVLFHKGNVFPLEDPCDVKYKLMTYYIKLWKDTGVLSTGECVVCYEENKIGSLMGCCNFKHFLCVGCTSAMYEAGNFNCPCCRENMVSVMTDRMTNQLNWYQQENRKNDARWGLFCKEAKNRISINKIIEYLRELELDSISEEFMQFTYGYDADTHSTSVFISEESHEYYWDLKSPIHFNKIQRKVGYKPMNLARMSRHMKTVME